MENFERFTSRDALTAKGKARAAWNLVCRPKDQRGMGIKPLKQWNEVLLINQLWKLIDKKECLWVKWVDTVKLKGQYIWEVKSTSNDSLGWKQVLESRDRIRPFVKHKVGNGKGTFIWYDYWCDLGPLSNTIPKRGRNDVRMRDNDSIDDLIYEGRWMWPNEWFSLYHGLNQINVPNLSNKKDIAVWIDEHNKEVEFSVKNAWKILREKWPCDMVLSMYT
nr:hypothetical protein [Tanacetum cinerariifolium]